MHYDRWQELISTLRKQGRIIEENKREEGIKKFEEVIVEIPKMGRIKLELLIKPRLINTVTHYSNRVGGSVDVEPQYSKDETVTVFNVYRWDDSVGNWQGIDPQAFAGMS